MVGSIRPLEIIDGITPRGDLLFDMFKTNEAAL